MENARRCQSCGAALTGRIDRKFCSDQCRATYNNRAKRPYEEAMKRLNSQLRKNRTILKTLCPTGKATVRREVLDGMGFSFRHFTSLYGSHPRTYFLCYDYGFMPLTEKASTDQQMVQKVLIIQFQDYMKEFDPWKYSV